MAICQRIKDTLTRTVSPVIRVSIGAAPNRYLAKTASKMRKPDGLQFIHATDLPEMLFPLSLRDLNGIARSMETRLHAVGIHTVRDLCLARKETLHHAWGGVVGDRFWHLIRGHEIPDLVSARKSIGHSHVLPPDRRHPDHAWPILCKLLHKAAERLRSHQLLTGCLHVRLAYLHAGAWEPAATLPETDSTLILMRLLARIWRDRPDPNQPLIQVALTLSRLAQPHQITPELFPCVIEDAVDPYGTKTPTACNPARLPQCAHLSPFPASESANPTQSALNQTEKLRRFDAAVDRLRARYGRDAVFLGAVHEARDQAPMRISFTHIPKLPLEQDD
jgi:DNA polymerase-4